METHGPVSAAEASAALASVERSRARVAWAGYPRWYWFGSAAGLGVLPFSVVLPEWLGLLGVAVTAVGLLRLVVVVGRARGVCEHPTRSAMRWQEITLLYGPTVLVLLAGAMASPFLWWSPIAAAVLVFVLFAGTGLVLSGRAARR